MKSESEVAQSCLTLCDPMDCSLPGSSVHGIFQARVLEWGAIAFSNPTHQGLPILDTNIYIYIYIHDIPKKAIIIIVAAIISNTYLRTLHPLSNLIFMIF